MLKQPAWKSKKFPMQAIVSRTGGKSRLRKTIIPLIPDHDRYVELFVGGGSIFFGHQQSKEEIINDLDKDIYNIYKDTKEVGDKIKGREFKPSREKWWRLLRQKKFHSPIERLYRNLYVTKMSFGGSRMSYIGDKEETRERFNKSSLPQKWQNDKFKQRLKDVKIENKDFKELIRKYDGAKTFFYLDPPYSRADKNKDYIVTGVTIEDVYNALKNIKGKFLLSYDDVPEAKKIFKNFNIIRVATKHSDGKGGQTLDRCELLIANYPISRGGGSCK
tara:strand:+ start:6 stop:830 length:825 start_codon:yes stop_codon:yes gene_type:complete